MSYCAVYLNRIYRERNCPEKPENPLILEKDIPYDADFTYIDFVPSVLTYSGQEVEFHKFSHLIETANSWLRQNSHWKVVNCETVKLSFRHNLTNMVSRWEQQINPASILWNSQLRVGEYETWLKVLRLWIRRKDIDDEDVVPMNESGKFAVTLKHLDFVPQRIGGGTGNTFECIDNMLKRLNERIGQPDASRWNILALQSLKLEANSEWNASDPEISLAEESSRQLIILRLFYEEHNYADSEYLFQSDLGGPGETACIGIEDFKPRLLSGGSFFKRPQFEPFSSLVQRATKWLTSQTGVYFVNAQSIDIKVKSLSKIDSRASTHIVHGDFIRMLRVTFLKYISNNSNEQSQDVEHPRPRSAQSSSSRGAETSFAASLQLGSKVILTTKYEHPLDSLQQRIHAWLKNELNVAVSVVSAETVDIYGKDDDERNLERALENCFQSNRLGSLNMYAFTAVRLFFCLLPKEEPKSALTKSTPSLSAGASRPNQTANSQFTRQEATPHNQRQIWSKGIAESVDESVAQGTVSGGSKPSKFNRQLSTAFEPHLAAGYTYKPTLIRRTTSQFESAPVPHEFDDNFDSQMRTRRSSTSCTCM